MRVTTVASTLVLGLSAAGLAQVATPGETKLGNATTGNAVAPANAADPAGNAADPGKR